MPAPVFTAKGTAKPIVLRRTVPAPAQELHDHQQALTEWGEAKGHLPPGTAAAIEAKFPRPKGKEIIATLLAKRSPVAAKAIAKGGLNTRANAPTPPVAKAKAKANPLLAPKAKTPTPEGVEPLPVEFSDLLEKLETARLRKNAWAREFSALEERAKDEFAKLDRESAEIALTARDEHNAEQEVTVTLAKIDGGTVEVETLDREALRRLTTPEIYDQCTVIQKGLVKEHAGDAVLKKITSSVTESVEGVLVQIKSKKAKGDLL